MRLSQDVTYHLPYICISSALSGEYSRTVSAHPPGLAEQKGDEEKRTFEEVQVCEVQL